MPWDVMGKLVPGKRVTKLVSGHRHIRFALLACQTGWPPYSHFILTFAGYD